jgi:hypothetical protein
VDVVPQPYPTSPFGNFLFVAEAGANRISKVSSTGAVSTFANLPAAPKRIMFTVRLGREPFNAFGNSLYATLANGALVRIDSAGVVSTCVSGLSGPEGLVFGPGGAFWASMLFVAESAANRISKVDPNCTAATPFVTSGLSNPIGLEVSPGNGWGEVAPDKFVLYVLNATGVSRVDQNGNVTPFASGFGNADTIRFGGFLGTPSTPATMFANEWRLRISDSATGTIEDIGINVPAVSYTYTGACQPAQCKIGDLFSLSTTFSNFSPKAVHVGVLGGFELPDGSSVNYAPMIGNDVLEVDLPAGFTTTINPWVSFNFPPIAPGRYCYRITFVAGAVLTNLTFYRTCFVFLGQ